MAVFSWDNYVDDSTITNSTAEGSETLTKENLKTRQLGDVFRHTFPAASPLGGTLILDFDLGSALSTNLIGILNHDMGGLAYTVAFGTSAGASDVGTESGTFWTGTSDDPTNELIYLSTAFSARYVRLSVTVSSTRTVDIGRLWLDSAWAVNVSMDFSVGIDDTSTMSRSKGGSVYTSSRKRGRLLNCKFFGLSTADIVGTTAPSDLDSFISIDMAVGTHGEVILLPLVDAKLNIQRLGVYGHLSRNEPIQFIDKGANGFISEKRLTVQEDF